MARAIKRVYSSHFYVYVAAASILVRLLSFRKIQSLLAAHKGAWRRAAAAAQSANTSSEKYKAVCVKLMASSSLSLWLGSHIYTQRVFQTTQTTRVMTLHFSKRKILCQRKNILAYNLLYLRWLPRDWFTARRGNSKKYYWDYFGRLCKSRSQLNQAE